MCAVLALPPANTRSVNAPGLVWVPTARAYPSIGPEFRSWRVNTCWKSLPPATPEIHAASENRPAKSQGAPSRPHPSRVTAIRTPSTTRTYRDRRAGFRRSAKYGARMRYTLAVLLIAVGCDGTIHERGIVTDAKTHQPIAGAKVWFGDRVM